MEKIYIYKVKNKEDRKMLNLSYRINGLSYLGIQEGYMSFKLDKKLQRKIKLLNLASGEGVRKPKKIVSLYKIVKKSRLLTEDQQKKFINEIWMNKWSDKYTPDKSYKKMPKGITKDNQDDYKKGSGNQSGKGKSFCKECHFTFKHYPYPIGNRKLGWYEYKENIKCQNCGAENSTIWLHSSVRVPKKDASKKVWKNFYKLFVK